MTNEINVVTTDPASTEQKKPLKLDLGCGGKKINEEFTGVDIRPFNGVDVVLNLVEKEANLSNENVSVVELHYTKHIFKKWPWEDNSVDEIFCSHFIEHLTPEERVHFVNEAWRVMKKDATMRLIAPHWCSTRAYGDLEHQWPPICEMWLFYLSKQWRDQEAPHSDYYNCNFSAGYGYAMRQDLHVRNEEYKQMALQNWKETAQDIIATLTKI